MDREISVLGEQVIYHPWRLDSIERRVDMSAHLKTIEAEMQKLFMQGKPRLIGVEGQSGSGKSGFAALLKKAGVDVKIIDVGQLVERVDRRVDISNLLVDPGTTYIIDEMEYVEPCCVVQIQQHIESGGTIVFMAQSRLRIELGIDINWLRLCRNGLYVG
ncbi:hypothetical protein L1D14_07630 [Vibrio tubiashii]|uniref:hypothetical protein n=1 Tax=Vibrio tubiashii TaxID=29498 RepID=UPI001EFE20D2|nr:hypothetical protein [Vibrio tubiashii]MCG9576109.1 hypothetical protein [Vibrio tubiashii]